MNRAFSPPTAPAPASSYSQAVEVPANARWLVISGQVGVAPDGKVAAGIEAQLEQIYTNIAAVLKAGGMDVPDLVKLTVYLLKPEDIAAARKVRDKHLGGHKPASTLAIIAALASPQFLAEVEAIAAKA
ncbi:MAG: RidA family protein [Proteobacteria bacterium]|nr:RidA family protein [Pseudomonadota bacterium]MBI3498566.1 RidA family protein [Pseudomonadota bacterium]